MMNDGRFYFIVGVYELPLPCLSTIGHTHGGLLSSAVRVSFAAVRSPETDVRDGEHRPTWTRPREIEPC